MTAIEDKLQSGVPEAIQTLLDAGIKARAPTPFSPAMNLGGVTEQAH